VSNFLSTDVSIKLASRLPLSTLPTTYILYSETTTDNLARNLGLAEYSYFFVRELFRVMLAKSSRVVVIADPPSEVDQVYDECRLRGELCFFLSFAPPHRSFIDIRCPTIPVFAWEFDTIPTETWSNDRRNDWRFVLSRFQLGVTHSIYSARAVRAAMGDDFRIESIPAPLWEVARQGLAVDTSGTDVELRMVNAFDSSTTLPTYLILESDQPAVSIKPSRLMSRSLQRHLARLKRSINKRVNRSQVQRAHADLSAVKRIQFASHEVVYTSVFNPFDGRKNWEDMLSAFCIALADRSDATLVFKLIHHDGLRAIRQIAFRLGQMPARKCRVVVIGDFLDDASYRKLLSVSKFAINASLSEGQCLPLMELMATGKPAIAPKHTGMVEYINEDTAFVVEAHPEPCSWPQDPRGAVRARRFRVNWQSLHQAFLDSYQVATSNPQRYADMSRNAVRAQREFCSEEVVYEKLIKFISSNSAIGSLTESEGKSARVANVSIVQGR
jgi:glycosyltransferase involved in cell wall biosynthesis